MPSIINRAGVVADFGEETGGDSSQADEAPVETKAIEQTKPTRKSKPKTTKPK